MFLPAFLECRRTRSAGAAIFRSAGAGAAMTHPPGNMTGTPDPAREAGMDALSDVLRVAHLTGGVFLHAEFFAPWGIATRVGPEHCAPGLGPALGPASHLIPYHYIIEGEVQARVDGAAGPGLSAAPGGCVR